MRLVMHIFRKDARRLWWEIAVALGLLIWLMRMDAWRADYQPDPMEGWLNLLVPFTWSYLIALVVLEDPLLGDRQFWVALPCRWPVLAGAKLLFTIVFILLPYLLASALLMGARGFAPWLYLSPLLWKQLEVAAMLILPAIAIAAVVRSVTQFVMIAVILVSVAVLLESRPPWISADYIRNGSSIAVLASGAIAVAVVQYSSRSLAKARLLGVLAVQGAVALYLWLPEPVTASLQCEADSAVSGPYSVRVVERPDPLPDAFRRMLARNGKAAVIPVEISGGPGAPVRAWFDTLSMKIISSSGEVLQWRTAPPASHRDPGVFQAQLVSREEMPPVLALTMSNAVFQRLAKGPVRLRGQMRASSRRPGDETVLPANGSVIAPGVGHCTSSFVEAQRLNGEMWKVHCESPYALPSTQVQISMEDGRVWRNRLGDAANITAYPQYTWLSPLHRRDTFFHLVEAERPAWGGTTYQVPRGYVEKAKLTVRPEANAGCAIFNFEMAELDLNRYVNEN